MYLPRYYGSAVGVVFTIMGLACRPSDVPQAASAAVPGANQPNASPVEVMNLLHQHHLKRDYQAISPWLVAEDREKSLALLRALDLVLDANDALSRTAENRFHGPMTDTWTLAAMRNNIGPFSEKIQLVSQQFKGDSATVTFQAGRNIPLIHAQFVLVEGRWLYRPEPSPPALTTELRELARVLSDVRESVVGGASFESYLDSFFYRVLPQMIRVATVQGDRPTRVAAGESGE